KFVHADKSGQARALAPSGDSCSTVEFVPETANTAEGYAGLGFLRRDAPERSPPGPCSPGDPYPLTTSRRPLNNSSPNRASLRVPTAAPRALNGLAILTQVLWNAFPQRSGGGSLKGGARRLGAPALGSG